VNTKTPDAARCSAALEAAWQYWRWAADTDESWTRDYLAGRGMRSLPAGYAPGGGRRTIGALRRRGFTDDELETAGLATRTTSGTLLDTFRDRLVLPVRDRTSAIVGFTARRAPTKDEVTGGPKYLNTTSTPTYDKSSAWYGMDTHTARKITTGAAPVITEGAFDVEAVRRVGANLAPLASCGTAVTTTQLEQIRALDPSALTRLVIATDPDNAGRAAARRVWDMLTPAEQTTARVAVLPGGDPADLIKAGRTSDLREHLTTGAVPLIHLVIDDALASHDLEHLEGRVAAVRIAAHQIAPTGAPGAAIAAAYLTTVLAGRLDHTTIPTLLLEALTAP